MVVKPVQPTNALLLIEITEEGILMVVMPVQFANAAIPMEVTLYETPENKIVVGIEMLPVYVPPLLITSTELAEDILYLMLSNVNVVCANTLDIANNKSIKIEMNFFII